MFVIENLENTDKVLRRKAIIDRHRKAVKVTKRPVELPCTSD